MVDSVLASDQHYDRNDVEIIKCEPCFKGFFRINRYHLRHKLFAGGWGDVIQREMFERGHAAAVLLYDIERDQIVLLEQFRLGAVETKQDPWLLELVAGIVEDGEQPDEVIHREAEEEAGIRLQKADFALSFMVSPGGTTERIHLYVGKVDSAQAEGLHGLAYEGEDIRLHVVSREQAYRWVEEGRIDNATTVIALQWLELHRAELQKSWLGES
jgi:ADP-ribose pyrophosphatase